MCTTFISCDSVCLFFHDHFAFLSLNSCFNKCRAFPSSPFIVCFNNFQSFNPLHSPAGQTILQPYLPLPPLLTLVIAALTTQYYPLNHSLFSIPQPSSWLSNFTTLPAFTCLCRPQLSICSLNIPNLILKVAKLSNFFLCCYFPFCLLISFYLHLTTSYFLNINPTLYLYDALIKAASSLLLFLKMSAPYFPFFGGLKSIKPICSMSVICFCAIAWPRQALVSIRQKSHFGS